MESKASTTISTGSYINAGSASGYYRDGVKIKRMNLLKWMQRTGYSAYCVARAMRIHPRQLERKLQKDKPFTKGQIRRLVYLMGAWEAFFVIYFPTRQERRRIFLETFGFAMEEPKHKRKKQRIIWAKEKAEGGKHE